MLSGTYGVRYALAKFGSASPVLVVKVGAPQAELGLKGAMQKADVSMGSSVRLLMLYAHQNLRLQNELALPRPGLDLIACKAC